MAGLNWTGFNYFTKASKMTGLINLTKPSTFNEDSVIPTEEIQRDMDRVKVVARHVSSMKEINQLNETDFENLLRNLPFTTAMHSAYPKVELLPENIVDIKTLSEHAGNTVLERKFLLCRTITPASQMRAIKTIVEDPAGEHSIRIVLYNYSTSVPRVTKIENVLPTGSFLAIKNPWFSRIKSNGSAQLICEDPSQVELLSLKSVTKMFPGVKWVGGFPQLELFPNENVWSEVSGTDQETREVLKKLGDVAFVEKRFTDAIRWYNLALDYASDDEDFRVEIHSNRAATFLNLRCFHRALEDAERVLQEKPSHVKAVYRKTKALMGLGKYAEAGDFISENIKAYEALAENKDLLGVSSMARILSSQLAKDEVDVDMMKLVKVSESVDFVDDVLQFTGPVERRTLQNGCGDTRGLVATKDIRPGRLLLSSKAFAFYRMQTHGSSLNQILETNEIENLRTGRKFKPNDIHQEHFALCAQIAYKIHFEPEESGREFYSLYTETEETGELSKDSNDSWLVDMRRIHKILQCNTFGTALGERVSLVVQDGTYRTYAGLWILPSFLNHNCCDANAMWCTVGDIFILRAIKPIKKGEEIKITFVLPSLPYDMRKKSVMLDFCNCRLCELDKADEDNGNAKKRSDLLEKLDTFPGNPHLNYKEIIGTIAQLESLRKQNPELDTWLDTGVACRITTLLFHSRQMYKSLDLWEKAICMQREVGLTLSVISTSVVVLQCYLKLGDKKSLLKWVKTLKEDLIAGYGCIEIMKLVDEGGVGILGKLEAVGINFFDE